MGHKIFFTEFFMTPVAAIITITPIQISDNHATTRARCFFGYEPSGYFSGSHNY
jgi:hypothetical protein